MKVGFWLSYETLFLLDGEIQLIKNVANLGNAFVRRIYFSQTIKTLLPFAVFRENNMWLWNYPVIMSYIIRLVSWDYFREGFLVESLHLEKEGAVDEVNT